MTQRTNPQARSAAYFDAISKMKKVKELGITPDMSQEAQDDLVEKLSTAKALKAHMDGEEAKVADFRNGQAWYVESLVEFAGMSPEEQLAKCYEQKFAEHATDDEMLMALAAMSVAEQPPAH